MELDKLMIAIVVISMVSVGIGSLLVEVTGRYGVDVSPQFQTTFNKMNESMDLTEEIVTDIKGASASESTDTWDIIETVKAGLNAVKVVFVQGIPTLFQTINSLGSFIPLPGIIIKTIQAILVIGIAFALVYLYFRYKNP